jgi:hypothetical protein
VGGDRVETRSLDASSAPLAMTHPQEFRSGAKQLEIPLGDSTLNLTLHPYSVVRINSAATAPREEGLQE